MRRCPRGWRKVFLVLSIFIGHRFLLLMYSEFSNIDRIDVDRTYVIANINPSNVVPIRRVSVSESVSTTTTTTTTTTKATTTTTAMLEQDYYRRQATIVNPFPYTTITTPRIACPHDVFLVIVIHSHPTYRDRRDAIRRTWGRYGNGHVEAKGLTRVVFSLGVDTNVSADTIRSESDIYDDIIQANFTDAYRNMTIKSLFGLKWVSENCDRDTVPYMLKSDDDMFISIPYLIDILLTRRPTRSIMGPLNKQSKVYRTGKWALTKTTFPFVWYPPYEGGSCYVISNDIVRGLYETSAYVTPIFIDDVYVTGILARIIGVNHVRQKGFSWWGDRPPTACDFISRKKIAGTKATPTLMYVLWKEVNNANSSCRTPSSPVGVGTEKMKAVLTNTRVI